MSIKITTQVLERLNEVSALYVQAAGTDPRNDKGLRTDLRRLTQRVSQVLAYPWAIIVDDCWLDVLFQDELDWPEHIQDYEAYLDYTCDGYYRSFGYLICFSQYEDAQRFQWKLNNW